MTIFSTFFPLIVDYIGIACMHSTVRKVCHKYDSLSRVTDPFRENTRGGYRELHLPCPEATVPSLWAPAARPLPLGSPVVHCVPWPLFLGAILDWEYLCSVFRPSQGTELDKWKTMLSNLPSAQSRCLCPSS